MKLPEEKNITPLVRIPFMAEPEHIAEFKEKMAYNRGYNDCREKTKELNKNTMPPWYDRVNVEIVLGQGTLNRMKNSNTSGFTTVEVVFSLTIFLGIFLLIVVLAGLPFVRISQLGEGEHNGYVTAVDQRGYVFKNYDLYFKTDNSSSQEDLYCVDRRDIELIKKAQEVNRERKQVLLKYKGVRGIGLGLCEGHQVIGIEINNEDN